MAFSPVDAARDAHKPLLLDAFCCAGGATRGYQHAGFHVVGVDTEPQSEYCGDEFYQADAISFITEHGHKFDAIAASPPCQRYSPLNAYNHKDYPDLIAPVRKTLRAAARPYVIENVAAASPELMNPVMLCGSMFGLTVYRHRLFETSFPLPTPIHPAHAARCVRNGYLPTVDRPFMTITGGKHSHSWREAANTAMETPWMRTIRQVCEAIPPAYTRYIGTHLLSFLGLFGLVAAQGVA